MKNLLIRYTFFVFFIGLFVYYYISNPEVFKSIESYNYAYILLGCAYTLVTITVNGMFMKLIIDTRSRPMAISDGFYTSFMSTLMNYFLPFRSGSLVRAGYLKKKYGFSYRDFMAMLYGNYVLIFAVSSFIGIVSVLFLNFDSYGVDVFLLSILLVIFSLSMLLLFASKVFNSIILNVFGHIKFRPIDFVISKVQRVIEGWGVIIKNKNLMIKITVLIAINIFAQTVFYYLSLNAIGAQVGIFHILLFTSVTILSIFFSFTPGSIGVRETFLILYAGSLSLTTEQILSATLLDRATTILVLIVLFLMYQFFSKTKKPSKIWQDTFGSVD